MPRKFTIKRIVQIVERDELIGICRACGAEQSPIEPDAENVTCETCGKRRVFGAEQLLFECSGF